MDVDATGQETSPQTVREEGTTVSKSSAECSNNNNNNNIVPRPGKTRPRPPLPQKPGVAPKPVAAGSSPGPAAPSPRPKPASPAPQASAPRAPPKVRPRTSLPRPPSPPPKPPPGQASSPPGGQGGEGGKDPLTEEVEAVQLHGRGERSLKATATTAAAAESSAEQGYGGEGSQQNGGIECGSSQDSPCKGSGTPPGDESLPQGDLETDGGSVETSAACKNGNASSRLSAESPLGSATPLPDGSTSPGESDRSSLTRSPPATLPKSKPPTPSTVPKSSNSCSNGESVHSQPTKSPPQTLPKPRASPNGSTALPSQDSIGEENSSKDTGLKSPPGTLPKPKISSQTEDKEAAISNSVEAEAMCKTCDDSETSNETKVDATPAADAETKVELPSTCAKFTAPSVFPGESLTPTTQVSDGPAPSDAAVTQGASDGGLHGQSAPTQPTKPKRPAKLPPRRPDKSPALQHTKPGESCQGPGPASPQPGPACEKSGSGQGGASPKHKSPNKAERTGSLGRGTKHPSKPPPPPPKNPPAASPKISGSNQTSSASPAAVPRALKPLPPLPKTPPVAHQSVVSPSDPPRSKTMLQSQESLTEPVEVSSAQSAPSSQSGDGVAHPSVPSKPLPPLPASAGNLSPRPSASPSLSAKLSSVKDPSQPPAVSSEPVAAQPSSSKSASQEPPPLPDKPPAGLPAMVGGKPVSEDKNPPDTPTTPTTPTTPKAPTRKVSRAKSKKNLPPPPPPPTKSSTVWHVQFDSGNKEEKVEEKKGKKARSKFYVNDPDQEGDGVDGEGTTQSESALERSRSVDGGDVEPSAIGGEEMGHAGKESSRTVPPSPSSASAPMHDLKCVLKTGVASQEQSEGTKSEDAASQESEVSASSERGEDSVPCQEASEATPSRKARPPPPRPVPKRRSLSLQKTESEQAEASPAPAQPESSAPQSEDKTSGGSENAEPVEHSQEADESESPPSSARSEDLEEKKSTLNIAEEPTDTCDMLKEIEELLNKRLVETGDGDSNQSVVLSESPLSHRKSGSLAGSEDSLSRADHDDADSNTSSPRRPPRPKREASKKRASFSSFDLRPESDSEQSSGGTMPRKPHPPKPERKSLTRVGRSQSDVSGMKSVADKEEEKQDGKKPYLPPRKESLAYAERGPPPLPPRNAPTGGSRDSVASVAGSEGSPMLTRADPNRGGSLRACPPGKPPRMSLTRPSRPAPTPPPQQATKRHSAQYRRIQTEPDSETGIWGTIVSNDHDYHEIEYHQISDTMVVPVLKGEGEKGGGGKESSPPPELPPRNYFPPAAQGGRQAGGSDQGEDGGGEREETLKAKCHDMSGSSPSTNGRPISNVSQQSSQSTGSGGSGASGQGGALGEDSSASDDEPESEEKQKKKREKKVFNIVKEIASSEQVFVDVLKLLNIDFRHAVSKATEAHGRNVIPTEMLNKILDYLPQLQNFNEDFLHDLNERVENWEAHPQVADIFVKKGPFLKMYSSYIRNFENASAQLDEACKKYPAFQAAVKDFEMSPRCASLALHHYMLKPIQRIPQYRLLLQEYCKHITPESPDHKNTITALNIVSEVADHANESMRHGDKLKKLMDIQHSLIGQFEVIQPGRVFIKDGELKKLSRKEMQPRMFFLFSDVLLYTTMVASGYRINNILPLTGMKVSKPKEVEDFKNEFCIISVQRSFTVAAETPEERDSWINALTTAIKEVTERRHTFESSREGPQTSLLDNDFVVGEKFPIWVPDARVTMCMLCLSEFTITWRRHHCRACGRVVCGNCSENEAPLRYLKYKTARVCDECYDTLIKMMEERGKSGGAEPVEEEEGGGMEDSKPINVSNLLGRFQRFRRSSHARRSSTFRPAVLKEVKANDEGSAMSGYLKMYRNKKWKQLWFVVKDKVLYMYKASEDMAAIESIPLLGYEVDRATHRDVAETTKSFFGTLMRKLLTLQYFEKAEPNLIFTLSHSNMPKLIFRTDSAAATTKWINVMREASVA